MKKLKAFDVVLILLISTSAISQVSIVRNQPVRIKNPYLKFKERSNLSYIVFGYNPFTTKINGKGESFEITPYKIPDIFSDVTAKGPSESVEKEKDTGGNPPQADVSQEDDNEDLKKEFTKYYRVFIENLQKINVLSKMEDHIASIFKDDTIDSVSFRKNIDNIISSISSNPRKDIQNYLGSLNESYSYLKFNFDGLSKTLKEEDFTFKGKLNDDKKDVALSVNEAKATVARKKYFAEEYAYATAKFNQLNTDSIRTAIIYKVNNAVDLQEKAKNTPWVHTYEPGNDLKDYRSDTIRIENLKGTVIQTYGPFIHYVHGQLKVDVSGGYLGSFGGDDNYTKTYDKDGKLTGVKKGNRDDIKNSIGVLMHGYKKWKGDISIGASAGFSLPIENSINFFVGPSLFFNGKNRFIISAGLSYTKLKKLNQSNLKESSNGNDYDFVNETSTDILYDNVYRLRPFAGITYNLFSLKQ